MPKRQDLHPRVIDDLEVDVVADAAQVDSADAHRSRHRSADEVGPLLESRHEPVEFYIEGVGRLLTVLQPPGPRVGDRRCGARRELDAEDGLAFFAQGTQERPGIHELARGRLRLAGANQT